MRKENSLLSSCFCWLLAQLEWLVVTTIESSDTEKNTMSLTLKVVYCVPPRILTQNSECHCTRLLLSQPQLSYALNCTSLHCKLHH